MSQYGAYGRALAGQTYRQILSAYYTGTTIGTISAGTQVRVQLAASHVPTAASPARVTARRGGWTSGAFLDSVGVPTVFPADSYVDMVKTANGWEADVHDAGGALLAQTMTTDVTVKPASGATLMEIKWRDTNQSYTLVRGSIRLLVNGSGIEAINILSMDDYLKAVVPAEMPASWSIEALRAQAVAARGYAYLRLKPGSAYDIRPTAANQVYSGYARERARSTLAVTSTKGQVVKYGGKVANTFFFAIDGGATENNEDVWGVTRTGRITAHPIPYLRGIKDVAPNGVAYDSIARNYRWSSATFTMTQLSNVLSKDPRTSVGTLISVKFDRGFSGRIYRATIVGSTRTVSVSGAIFKKVYNANRLAGPELRSTMFWLKTG